jgi:pimeloyl-ACP methyl ester carboxylesterase
MNSKIPPAMGKLVDVGDHRLHIYTKGQGSPSVVFEAGGLGWSLDWVPVLTEVEKFTQACAYDRAGFGWSEPGPRPRTAAQMVGELHTLLHRAIIQPPFLLVGASFGGAIVRLYAHQYPGEVAGIVLIDARHPDLDAKMPPTWHKLQKSGQGMCQFMLLASRLRLLNVLGKLAGEKAYPPVLGKLPEAMRPVYLAVGYQPKYFQANLDELAAVAESDRQLKTVHSLGSLPLTVIRHGIPSLFKGMPSAQAEQAEQAWQDLQVELSQSSTDSRLFVAEGSGHNITVDQPELVVEAIRQMVGMIRQVSPFDGLNLNHFTQSQEAEDEVVVGKA